VSNRALVRCVAVLICAAAIPASVSARQTNEPAPQAQAKATRSGHVPVNGVSYYYEVRGKGMPLLLLHGGLGHMGMFDPIMPALSEHHEVIAIDLEGHGRSTLSKRDMDFRVWGDDMAAVVEQLGYRQIDVLGYSLGGGVAFRFAAQHPQLVRKLVIVSFGFAQQQFFPEMLPQQGALSAAMAAQMQDTPMYKSYVAVAPDPREFPRLLDGLGKLMRTPYNWSNDVPKLTMPVMLVYGDSDMIRPEHMIAFYRMLGGGLRDAGWQREHMSRNRLAILPDVTHYEMFFSPRLPQTVLPFLDGTGAAKSWSDNVGS